MSLAAQTTALIAALEQLGPHDHFCSIYESPREHYAVAIPFMRIGLDRDEKCIYIADDGTVGDVREAMQSEGIDVDRAIASKALVLTTKEQAYLQHGSFHPEWVFTFWKEAEQLAVSEGLAAPLQTRALSLVAAAIYDSTVAAWDSKYTYMRQHPSEIDSGVTTVVKPTASPSYPSEHAVTAGAAAAVLAYLFPNHASSFTDMADQAGQSRIFAGVAFPSDVISGMDLGNQIGQAVITYAKADGSNQIFTGSYPAAPGVWSSPTPVTPLAGTWHPWVLTGGNQFRPAAPPAFGSNDANTQYAAVKNLQRTNGTNHLAWFWQPGFFQPWLQQVETEIFQNHQDSNAPRAAQPAEPKPAKLVKAPVVRVTESWRQHSYITCHERARDRPT